MSVLLAESIHDHLTQLLAENDLDFHGETSSGASHSLHAFAAKFPPQLPALFIRELTLPGETVLDPMVGSGTTIVEAYQLGRQAIGTDIDPLAVMICRVKTTRLDSELIAVAGEHVLDRSKKILGQKATIERFLANQPEENRKFIDYWFARETQQELAALLLAIDKETNDAIREFLRLVLSSIIITKSGGVSLARDLAHSRPHKDLSKRPRSALEVFRVKLEKAGRSLGKLRNPTDSIVARGELADCRTRLPVDDGSVDLIVTSPPYANAIDYMRAHKFSLVWFGKSLSDLSELRAEYIGAEKVGQYLHPPLPAKVERVVRLVGQADPRKSSILRKYFVDMTAAMSEMYRVLRPGRATILVVGPSTIRGRRVDTPRCLGEIAKALRYEVVGIKRRKLDRNRRMMPARFRNNGQSVIEKRMHEEYVIGLVKS